MSVRPPFTRRVQRLVRRLPAPLAGRLIRRGFRVDYERAADVVFKVAETRDELEAAYRLVHDVYVTEGYSDPDESGMRINLRYPLPTTTTFIGAYEGQVVITMTLIGDTPLGLPMDAIFSKELYELRLAGRSIAEVSALASHPGFRRRRQAVAMYLNKTMITYAMHNLAIDDLVIAVNPKHEWVYLHTILFETISRRVRRYHYVKGAPAVAMRLDLRTAPGRWRSAYRGRPPARDIHHFIMTHDPPGIRLPAAGGPYDVWDEALFRHFFEHETQPRRRDRGSLLERYRSVLDPPQQPSREDSNPGIEQPPGVDGSLGRRWSSRQP